ncbi:DUF262 domain-containing protein [Mycolicibacterium sp. XJ870]
MQGSTPQVYTIADFLKWHDDEELVLNPNFQRGSVWSPQARTYLIDSILRGYPIPKLLLRTEVDRDTRRTKRDVVDGQQRLKTIIDFSADKLTLGTKAREFKGLKYSQLENDLKDQFLSYKLTCEQLLNASNEDVLEVFVRINSYAVPVSEAELRNARFDNDFSNLVKESVEHHRGLWQLGVISERERVRMVDQSLIAEAYSILANGVRDGAEADITRFYESMSKAHAELPSSASVDDALDSTVTLLQDFKDEAIVARPHFLMIYAAILYKKDKLPVGRLDFENIPSSAELTRAHDSAIQESFAVLNTALTNDQEDGFSAFRAARSTSQRTKSRQIRFEYFTRALAGQYAQ